MSENERNGRSTPVKEERVTRDALRSELDRMIDRLREHHPHYEPPPFTLEGVIRLVEQNICFFAPERQLGILQTLRERLDGETLDLDTIKGTWYLAQYTVQMQIDVVKRHLAGDYETDEWGLDWELLETIRPFLNLIYKFYFRVQTTGIDTIPDYSRALLVANRAGQIPVDAAMLGTAVFNEHPTQRLVRNLYAFWFPTLPFISSFLERMGQVMANEDNARRLLEQDELVGVFPEGYKGASKPFNKRYRLQRFGRGGFVRTAIATSAPIIPIAIVGSEETFITFTHSKTLAKLTGFPYFPISLRFPWLGLLGAVPLPSKWYIDVGKPIDTKQYGTDGANNLLLVNRLNDEIRETTQGMVNRRLAQRRSVYL